MTATHTDPVVIFLPPVGRARRLARAALHSLQTRRTGVHLLEPQDGEDALALLELAEADLILLGERVGGMETADFCRRARRSRQGKSIPLVILGSGDRGAELAALAAGADEYLRLPVEAGLLDARVGAHLRRKAVSDEREDMESVLFTLARAVEQRDSVTAGHCERLAHLSVRMGRRLGLGSAETEALYRGGFLHDIGKIAIPDAILFKAGPLSPNEWEIMTSHTVQGESICRPLRNLATVLPIIRHHHERFDGSGYPDGLAGEEIPLLARILQIADIYDALTTARPYKPACTPGEALKTLREEARLGWRDPDLVRLFGEILPAPDPAMPLRAIA